MVKYFSVDGKHVLDISKRLQSVIAQYPNMKEFAQRVFSVACICSADFWDSEVCLSCSRSPIWRPWFQIIFDLLLKQSSEVGTEGSFNGVRLLLINGTSLITLKSNCSSSKD